MDGMTRRRVRIVLLCEDTQQEAFARRFLKGMGWQTREMRIRKSPAARGSGEQWVRRQFPPELAEYRRRNARATSVLVAMLDADTVSLTARFDELREECAEKDLPFRQENERVAIIIPKRNIETWIHFLSGHEVNENAPYPKLQRERDCGPSVVELLRLCATTELPDNAPPSLAAACREYNERIAPAGR